MVFSVASYNILATAYITPRRYPRTPRMVLHPTWRMPALVQHVACLDADILCLQEVEVETFAALRARLGPLGYAAHYARKQGRQPEGCATFYRQGIFGFLAGDVVAYADGTEGTAASGHIALCLLLRQAGRTLGIANTHLTWEPPETRPQAHRGLRQIQQLLVACESRAHDCQAWILAGDFNVTPESVLVTTLQRAGWQYAHAHLPTTYTCNAHASARMIDYLFHSPTLAAEPREGPVIHDQTPLPSASQPSDHVAIHARFFWRETPPDKA